ncbi:PX domain-containing protein kinase-like protein [Nymphon striatum]|nr:PX domain-containing protein kinase-like protein [Nymphon striatum]
MPDSVVPDSTGLEDEDADDAWPTRFFDNVNYQKSMKPKWKFPSSLKPSLQKSKELTEVRLKEEQKLAKQNKRLSKIQKQLTSEDEKKRRKRLSKKMAENSKPDDSKPLENGQVTSGDSSSSLSASTVPTPPPAPISVNGPPAPPAPPPPPPSFGPPAPPPPPSSGPPPSAGNSRMALLGSIAGFKKGALKKSQTNDRSMPKV